MSFATPPQGSGASDQVQRYLESERVINALLMLALEPLALDVVLRKTLDLVLSISWLTLEAKGSIFLFDQKEQCLVLIVQRGLAEPLLRQCARVEPGRCICGRAALQRDLLFTPTVDDRHEISHEGMTAHGHYSVPIATPAAILGLLNLYLHEGHTRDANEELFLQAVANTLAGVISHHQMRNELVVERNKLRSILTGMNDGVAIINGRHEIEYANPALMRDFGPVQGGKCHEHFLGSGRPCSRCQVGSRSPGTVPRQLQVTETGKIYEISSTPLQNADGTTDRLEIFQDVTEREELEHRLRQAQKLEAIGRLAGGVAHDFNNILAVIMSSAEVLDRRLPADAADRGETARIKRSVKTASGMIQQLLAFSRKQVLAPQSVDLNEQVASTLKMIESLIGPEVEVVADLDPQLGMIMADPDQIAQVIMNLVINARDALPAGGRITVETTNVELDEAHVRRAVDAKPGPHVCINVIDDGTGIAAEDLERIFDPFFSTKAPDKGTGLGLSTVYGIVSQSSGHLTVESAPGQGSRFSVFLPRVNQRPVELPKSLRAAEDTVAGEQQQQQQHEHHDSR